MRDYAHAQEYSCSDHFFNILRNRNQTQGWSTSHHTLVAEDLHLIHEKVHLYSIYVLENILCPLMLNSEHVSNKALLFFISANLHLEQSRA